MTQRQEYRVINTYEGFELREYAPCTIAQVKVSADLTLAGSIAFRPLFQYISKTNNRSEKISMTSPVISSKEGEIKNSGEWSISFIMPKGTTMKLLPDPSDRRVKLHQLGTQTCIATPFRGKITEEIANVKARELRALAAKENIFLSNEIRICRFDPPIKPGFLQYNEIVIPLQ